MPKRSEGVQRANRLSFFFTLNMKIPACLVAVAVFVAGVTIAVVAVAGVA